MFDLARAGRPAREVRKTVSVVFCDVTCSTALGERLDPESTRDVPRGVCITDGSDENVGG